MRGKEEGEASSRIYCDALAGGGGMGRRACVCVACVCVHIRMCMHVCMRVCFRSRCTLGGPKIRTWLQSKNKTPGFALPFLTPSPFSLCSVAGAHSRPRSTAQALNNPTTNSLLPYYTF